MSLVIQKFGGTSVATEESREKVLEKIVNAKKQGHQVVVVVSAMGRKGSPYATDTLIRLASNIGTKDMDLLMSCGEIISASVLVNELLEKEITANVMTGGQAGIITDESYSSATILKVDPSRIFDLLANDIVPVITGFQGISQLGNVTTLGRGGSDTSASIIGEALDADAIEIYTDVNGIMTADPRVFPRAKVIDNISYTEVFQMADSGAKVIHPRAVEVARRAGIPLYIKNTFTDDSGTIIKNTKSTPKVLDGDRGNLITSIAHINNRVQYCLEDNKINDAKLFTELADSGVSIDIINIFPNKKIFTVDEKYINKVEEVLKNNNVNHSINKDCSKVTLIGERMTGVPGVMAKIISALQNQGVSILQTADSLTTIACLIHTKDLEITVKVLHETFGL